MSEDLIGKVATHLEFLGYKIDKQEDEWFTATHLRKANFYFREINGLLRFHASFYLGSTSSPDWRHKTLEFLNHLNDTAILAKFSLYSRDGAWGLRMRANLPTSYDRAVFGDLMDLWHSEADESSQIPDVPVEEEPSGQPVDAK